jgi:hypothetical protein
MGRRRAQTRRIIGCVECVDVGDGARLTRKLDHVVAVEIEETLRPPS